MCKNLLFQLDWNKEILELINESDIFISDFYVIKTGENNIPNVYTGTASKLKFVVVNSTTNLNEVVGDHHFVGENFTSELDVKVFNKDIQHEVMSSCCILVRKEWREAPLSHADYYSMALNNLGEWGFAPALSNEFWSDIMCPAELKNKGLD